MRLKKDLEKERSIVYRERAKAKKNKDNELVMLYTGMLNALDWVLDTRGTPYYTLTVEENRNEY